MGDYKCKAISELMKKHKSAKVMADQASFEVIVNSAGHAMIFCISSGGHFNLIVERPGTKTGWSVTDVSTGLSSLCQSEQTLAQHFAIKYTCEAESPNLVFWFFLSIEWREIPTPN